MTLHRKSEQQETESSGFVVDGDERLHAGVAEEARRIIEKKYADEWKSSGIFRRWKLQRIMNIEIAALVTEMKPDVSQDALF